jgi:hypothetical protein
MVDPMTSANGHKVPQEEEYADAYFYFEKSLNVLAEDAESQCKRMGYFNVAWELKDDVSRGATAVLNLHGGHLSVEQIEAIDRILKELACLPEDVLNVSNARVEHVSAMKHPVWDVIRTHAKDLLCLLGPETKRVEAILSKKTG